MGIKNEDATSVPSDIGDNEWGEITRFTAKKHELEQLQQKRKLEEKKRDIKLSLDRQVIDRKNELAKEGKEKKYYDNMIID